MSVEVIAGTFYVVFGADKFALCDAEVEKLLHALICYTDTQTCDRGHGSINPHR